MTRPAIAVKPSSPARRRQTRARDGLRAPAAGRDLRVAVLVPMLVSVQLLKNAREFLLERRNIAVVADDVIGACRLLVLRELA